MLSDAEQEAIAREDAMTSWRAIIKQATPRELVTRLYLITHPNSYLVDMVTGYVASAQDKRELAEYARERIAQDRSV